MKIDKIAISNFRSIGEEDVIIDLNKKITLLIGKNNCGKSSTIKILKIISDYFNKIEVKLSDTDFFNRESDIPIRFKLFGSLEDLPQERELTEKVKIRQIWLEYEWWKNQEPRLVNNSYAEIDDINLLYSILRDIFQLTFRGQADKDRHQLEIKKHSNDLLNILTINIPKIGIISEFRYIHDERDGIIKENCYDGTNLRELLSSYQNPTLDTDSVKKDYQKMIQMLRELSEINNINLNFPPRSEEFIIEEDLLRLLLENYGTGFHQLIIIASSVTRLENSICCIEEPEIHLHAQLQKRLINYLLSKTIGHYIITSHSPFLINCLQNNENVDILTFRKNGNKNQALIINTLPEIADLISDLGITPSDILLANSIIWVEGSSDRHYFKKWINLFADDLIEGVDFVFSYFRQLPDLFLSYETPDKNEFVDILKLNHNVILIEDSDKKNENDVINKQKLKRKKSVEENGGYYLCTKGREVENYLSSRVINEGLKELHISNVEIDIQIYDDFSRKINKVFSEKKKKIDYDISKNELSRLFAEKITINDISDEQRNEILEIINKLRQWKKDQMIRFHKIIFYKNILLEIIN